MNTFESVWGKSEFSEREKRRAMNNRHFLYNNNFTLTIISSPLIPSCYIIISIIKSANIRSIIRVRYLDISLSVSPSLSLKITHQSALSATSHQTHPRCYTVSKPLGWSSSSRPRTVPCTVLSISSRTNSTTTTVSRRTIWSIFPELSWRTLARTRSRVPLGLGAWLPPVEVATFLFLVSVLVFVSNTTVV